MLNSTVIGLILITISICFLVLRCIMVNHDTILIYLFVLVILHINIYKNFIYLTKPEVSDSSMSNHSLGV